MQTADILAGLHSKPSGWDLTQTEHISRGKEHSLAGSPHTQELRGHVEPEPGPATDRAPENNFLLLPIKGLATLKAVVKLRNKWS